MTHKFADVLRWVADGETVECRAHASHAWAKWPEDFMPVQVANVVSGVGVFEFRLKPRTVKIGGREVEAPVLDLVAGQKYWSYDVVEGRPFETTYRSERSMSTRPGASGRLFASAEAAAAADAAYTALLRGEA